MTEASEATQERMVDGQSGFSSLLGNATGVLSAGAGAIHFAVIQAHFEEYWAFGVFFASVAWLQILWAMWVVARPGRLVALVGIAINGTITGVWVISRTVGIPFGPEPGVAEAVEFVDVAATSLQVLAILGALALLSRRATRRAVASSVVASFTLLLAAGVAVLATTAIISFTPHEEEEALSDEHQEEEGEAQGAMIRLRMVGRGIGTMADMVR